jgi:hypothetical protein
MDEEHMFTLPMDNDGLCGRCGKSCIDQVHVSFDRWLELRREYADEIKRHEPQGER